MDYWPFMLVVGTKSAETGKEEYRWTFMLGKTPPKGVVLCKDDMHAIRKDFLKEHFLHRPVYQDVNDIGKSVRRFWWARRLCYTVQIEHFPGESFPD